MIRIGGFWRKDVRPFYDDYIKAKQEKKHDDQHDQLIVCLMAFHDKLSLAIEKRSVQ
jgi:hypothetical protein